MGCLPCFNRVKSFHVKILLLDKQELIQEIQDATTGQDLLNNIFKHLNLIETAYFGLRYQDNSNQTVSRKRSMKPGKKKKNSLGRRQLLTRLRYKTLKNRRLFLD